MKKGNIIIKGKPQGKVNMKDIAQEVYPNEENVNKVFMMPDTPAKPKKKVYNPDKLVDGVYDDNAQKRYRALQEEIENYNKSITELDVDYATFTPNRFVLVRAYKKEYRSLGDSKVLIEAPETRVEVLTSNGMGYLKPAKCPWSFDNKAVIVSIPDYDRKNKPGDIVQLHESAFISSKVGNDSKFTLKSGFILASRGFEVPTSVKDPNFGYLLIRDELILGTLIKVPREEVIEEEN